MTIKQAKEMDMVAYLASLGFNPQKVSSYNYWFYSPFRNERTASFKVNKRRNCRYDFGIGEGGNLIDFGLLYFQCKVSEFLHRLDLQNADIKLPAKSDFSKLNQSNFKPNIEVISVAKITYLTLLNYVHQRKIHPVISNEYLEEITYQNGAEIYQALGFKNDSGGYELRSQNFKGSGSPKDIRFIDFISPELAVFEGFFDFLSYLTMYHKQEPPKRNFLVLSSTSFF